jgi:NAD(P)-dependent dehydrogenase (short-subunit alcohol dehydrogenase family)
VVGLASWAPMVSDDDDELSERLRAVTEELEALAADRSRLHRLPDAERIRLLNAAGDVFSPDVEARRRQAKARRRQEKLDKRRIEQEVLIGTGIRRLRSRPVFTTPNVFPPGGLHQETVEGPGDGPLREAPEPQHCYVCKQHYGRVHHFYDQLCPTCAEVSFAKRTETADLRGRVALLTGGRVKIGYQAAIKLLRAGAHLIVTSRFPRDAAVRYSQEEDFADWSDRLEVHGLDLRHIPSVESFCAYLERSHHRLDHIVNNACQTVRRPPAFYRHMLEREAAAFASLPMHVQALLGGHDGVRGVDLVGESPAALALGASLDVRRPAELSQLPLLPEDLEHGAQLFPDGTLDQDLQQVDLRGRNSWRLTLAEVSSVELLETQLVNAVAPFVLNARLKPLMLRTPERDKHIVNVSAVEGQFYRRFKTTKHPHTNMAKAALNMMTRTSAADYHADGIHMNSVDTGWVSDEDPVHIAEQKQAEHGFHPPLDIVDGAARIVDPIISGVNTGEHVWGQFLKDFRPTDW